MGERWEEKGKGEREERGVDKVMREWVREERDREEIEKLEREGEKCTNTGKEGKKRRRKLQK